MVGVAIGEACLPVLLSARPARPAPDQRLWPSTPSGVKGRYGAPPRCPLAGQLVTALTRAAGSASLLGRWPPLDPAWRCRQGHAHRSKGEPCSETEPDPGVDVAPSQRIWGVIATTAGQITIAGCLGALTQSRLSGQPANSSTPIPITIAPRAIMATGRATSPHRSHHCDYLSAPPDGDISIHTRAPCGANVTLPATSPAGRPVGIAAQQAAGIRSCRCVKGRPAFGAMAGMGAFTDAARSRVMLRDLRPNRDASGSTLGSSVLARSNRSARSRVSCPPRNAHAGPPVAAAGPLPPYGTYGIRGALHPPAVSET